MHLLLHGVELYCHTIMLKCGATTLSTICTWARIRKCTWRMWLLRRHRLASRPSHPSHPMPWALCQLRPPGLHSLYARRSTHLCFLHSLRTPRLRAWQAPPPPTPPVAQPPRRPQQLWPAACPRPRPRRKMSYLPWILTLNVQMWSCSAMCEHARSSQHRSTHARASMRAAAGPGAAYLWSASQSSWRCGAAPRAGLLALRDVVVTAGSACRMTWIHTLSS